MATPFLRSLTIMRVYSQIEKRNSLLDDVGIEIDMPSGKNWFPLVMTFQDDEGFSQWAGKDCRLTILYTFPAFSGWYGQTAGFDPESDYYSAFYGAYAVQNADGSAFGFREDGSLADEEAALVPQFDMTCLVLEDFGLDRQDAVFSWETTQESEVLQTAGVNQWIRLEANVTVSGMYHHKTTNARSYLQYGNPPGDREAEDFAPVELKGLLYARYFPEQHCSVFFYALARTEAILLDVEENAFAKSQIRIRS